MNNWPIYEHPDVVALACAWWDETQSFRRGTTSAVLADLMEELGFEEDSKGPSLLEWMRKPAADGGELDYYNDDGPFHVAARVYRVGFGSSASPVFRFACQWAAAELQDEDGECCLLGSRAELGLLASSREIREWMTDRGFPTGLDPMTGLGRDVYGWRVVLNRYQPKGHLDFVRGDKIVTARVY